MTSTTPKPRIEIGIVVAGQFDQVDQAAMQRALHMAREYWEQTFPELRFELYPLQHPESSAAGVAEPSLLLREAVEERDTHHWDFVLVLTAAELKSYFSTRCFAALSRALDAAVISLSLIDPQALGETADESSRVERVAYRLSRMLLQAVAHLTGVGRSDEAHNLMYHPPSAHALDAMQALTERQIERQRQSLRETADQRLEERSQRLWTSPAFAIGASWINRREILQAVVAARPWQLPRRFSRLTLASVSTVAILLMTAEAWDLALSQDGMRVAVLTIGSWCLTTAYVIGRQQLLVRRQQRRSEQAVVTSASAIGILLVGMLVTWCGLYFIALLFGGVFFGPDLIAAWASSSQASLLANGWLAKFWMAAFSASLGLLIGALGASFESQHYFRHVVFVDEEI